MDVKAGHGWGAWLPWDLQVATMVCSRIFSPVQSGYPPSSTSTPLTYNLLSDMLSTRSGYIIESGIINGR